MANHVMTATRFVRRHPKATSSAALFAARHWRGVANVAGVSHKAVRQGQKTARQGHAVIGKVTEPSLREEVRSAFSELSAALDRSRQVGIENALSDKQVSKRLTRAGDHASSVWAQLAEAPAQASKKRHRRFLRVLLAVATLFGVWQAVKSRLNP